ncbi:tripartite tricarboxylate transporter permease [Spiractinospora alimapuensis]|uniref:tripartite tricarboxylate transporter permease n=1 Tax=Spiractinospora alimapuensis TaxID=2820884 RepID=UPI001F1CF69C|nr:tripartite tricarboxylate transporter permease [Spiractinospora alimapuensis]QVQ53928.1 tripartite tricarboxylate transporter permease [Spiractinospora alimapuensis]
MLDALLQALTLMFTPMGILCLLAGAAVGLTFGILPGLGASQAMILLLPFTYGMDADYAILMFVAIMSSASFGGSLPAILINTPGTPANVCTTFDGHPMALKGQATRAIFLSAASCVAGTIVGAAALYALIPAISSIITEFTTRETFWLIIFGITMISLASKGNTIKGLVAGGLGLLLAFVGRNYVFPGERFTLGMDFLYDGIPEIALLVGLFAVTPMIFIGTRRYVVDPSVTKSAAGATARGTYVQQARQGIGDVLRRPGRTLGSSLFGVLMGIVPAVGGATAAFLSYLLNKQTSKHANEYGKGHPEGVIASEAANDSKDGGGLMPTLAFGIPGDINTAILLGALLMHGVSIGSTLFNQNLRLVMVIILALVLGQIAVALMGAAATPLVSRVTTVHTSYLVPIVVSFSFVGAYVSKGSVWDISIVVALAVLGYFLHLFNYPAVVLILGFLLGVDAERSFVQTMTISQGSIAGFFEGYIVWIIIGTMIATFAVTGFIGRRRVDTGDGSGEPADGSDGPGPRNRSDSTDEPGELAVTPAAGTGTAATATAIATEPTVPVSGPRKEERVIGIAFAVFLLLAIGGFMLAARSYDDGSGTFPLAIGAITGALMLVVLASEISPRVKRGIAKIDAGTPDMAEAEERPEVSYTALARNLQVLGWVVVFAAVVIYLGFMAFAPLVFAYIVRRGGMGMWRSALALSLTVGVIMYLTAVYAPQMYWVGGALKLIPGVVGGGVVPTLF